MPDWKEIVRDRLASLRLEGASEAALVEELSQHLESTYLEHTNAGASAQEAYRKAMAELEHLEPLRSHLQAHRPTAPQNPVVIGGGSSGNYFDHLWRDLRFSVRSLRKSPLFVLFVVLTLGLGIGANTTVFTVINTLLLNPLPIPDSSSVMSISRIKATGKSNQTAAPTPLSYPEIKDYQARNTVFRFFAAYSSPHLVTWQNNSASERMFSEVVTGTYFSTLGLTPFRGRFFRPDEDSVPGAHPVAVLNYGTWQTRFGGASDIIGRTVRLNTIAFTVIGVAPPHFIGVSALFGPDLWVPAAMAQQLFPEEMKDVLTARDKALFEGLAVLKPGVSQTAAQANLFAIAAELAREYPATNEDHTVTVRPVRDALFASSTGSTGAMIFASAGLMLVVGIVLLIACSNVANLLLARSSSREQEIAVRLAIGASRRRVISQLLTESVLLALLSGILGFIMGYAGLRLLFSALPSTSNFIQPKLDLTVFVFALLISLATGIIFGAIPALKTSRTSLVDTLKQETRTAGRSRHKVSLANALLVAQVAFSFVLLLTATLFVRSIQKAYNLDPGFQTAHLAIFMTSTTQAGYSEPETKAFYKDVRERVQRIPGVQSLSWSSNLPLWSRPVNGLEIVGRQQKSRADTVSTIVNTVDVDYFETAGATIESGRPFTSIDQDKTLPVAIVNEKIAHDFWPGQNPLGKQIRLPDEKQSRQVVGVARIANYTTWGEAPQPCVYVPLTQKFSGAMTLFVRTRQDPRGILAPVRQQLHQAAPRVFSNDVRTGQEIVEGGLFQARVGVALLSVFGLLALGLASIGLYGILGYSVSQRQREIGVRIALGAKRTAVLQLILRNGMTLVIIGLLIGFAGALAVTRLLSRLLYGVSAADPLSLVSAAAVLLGVALLACYLPARRASGIDPLAALREG